MPVKITARDVNVYYGPKRALNGMLTALDPNWQKPTENSLLPPRVERLMQETLAPAATPKAE